MPASPARSLYLVAYDIADPRRLGRVHRFLNGWKVGGQKSFYECWLTPAERATVISSLQDLIDPEDDRVHVFQLDPRMQPKCFGVALKPDSIAPIKIGKVRMRLRRKAVGLRREASRSSLECRYSENLTRIVW